ncbi:PD-(D/E)XK nuclease family protein [Actinoplanes sp. NPDC048791]|uniref:PD-(D/E)XK nuclease family protein n=1 Tax=Actinoplanes sp. NPDC048791 TaxID=3154623 RepID=UPI0033CAFE19
MNTRQHEEPGYWISPSSAARLLICPASVTTLQSRPSAPAGAQPWNAGRLAHVAVQCWIDAADWQAGDSTARLMNHLANALSAHGLNIGAIPGGRIAAARLELRAPALAETLRRLAQHAHVRAEVPLHDPQIKLWGIIDILIESNSLAIIDLKTGDATEKAGPGPRTRHQLLAYAALARASQSRWPATLAVFNLHHGYQAIHYDPHEADALVRRIIAARAAWTDGDRAAIPQQDNCRSCLRRLSCNPYWRASARWADEPSVEGTVRRAMTADNGKVALELNTAAGVMWLTNVTIKSGTEQLVGSRVRAVAVTVSQRREDRSPISLRATEKTALRID